MLSAIDISLCQVENYTSVGTSFSKNTTIHANHHLSSTILHPLRLSDFLGRFPHPPLPPIWLSLHSPPLTQPFNLLSHRSSRYHLHLRHCLHHRYRLPPRSHRYYPLSLLIHPTQIPPSSSIPPVIKPILPKIISLVIFLRTIPILLQILTSIHLRLTLKPDDSLMFHMPDSSSAS